MFYSDGTHGDTTAGDNVFSFQATVARATPWGSKTLAIAITDPQARTGSTSITQVAVANVPIRSIQGAGHLSPMAGQIVSTVPSIVTGKSSTGFYVQDPNPDNNVATSEGIFVYIASTPLGNTGDKVIVTGTVSEYRQSGSASTNLTLTELTSLLIRPVSTGNPLPAPVVIGNGGRLPPTAVVEDDVGGNVETGGVFDPGSDGIDFYESLEGMRVQVNDALVVGPRADFGSNREVYVVANSGAHSELRTSRGGLLIRPGDFNPERIVLNDVTAAGGGPTLPAVNVRDLQRRESGAE